MTSNNEFIKEFEEKFVSRTKSISGLISLWWLGIFGEHNNDTEQIEQVEDFILKILEQKDEEWSQLNLKVAKEALKQGRDSIKEKIFDFIMKNLYNEQTCERINEFFNKIK